jgi:hypothetical protein
MMELLTMSSSMYISDAFRVWEDAPQVLTSTGYSPSEIRGVYRMPNEEVEWQYQYEGTKRIVVGFKIKPLSKSKRS